MNVAELIAELQKHPADMAVWCSAEAGQVASEIISVDEGPEYREGPDVVWLDMGL